MKEYYVYIMTNKSRTLYTGVTNNLVARVYQHKQKMVQGFTKKYNINKLVYYEATTSIESAIAREKQIKGWLRKKKIALIERENFEWNDLAGDWYDEKDYSLASLVQNDKKGEALKNDNSFICLSPPAADEGSMEILQRVRRFRMTKKRRKGCKNETTGKKQASKF